MNKLLFALMISAASSNAAALLLNLDSASLTAQPGQTVSFGGTITSTFGATVDLNAINVSLLGNFAVDELPFFLGPPTVAANGTTVSFTLFNVTVNDPFPLPYGVYSGTVSLLGGVEVNDVYDPSVQDLLGQATFSVNVLDPVMPVPEPASGALLFAAVASFGVYRRFTNSER